MALGHPGLDMCQPHVDQSALTLMSTPGTEIDCPDEADRKGRSSTCQTRSGSYQQRAQRVARQDEPTLDEVEIAFERAVFVLDREGAVVAGRDERGDEAVP
jgi:hypothetical protein